MSNVVAFSGITRLDLPAEQVIDKAMAADLESVVVAGWGNDGEFYFASSIAAGPEVLWLLELAKLKLLKPSVDGEGS